EGPGARADRHKERDAIQEGADDRQGPGVARPPAFLCGPDEPGVPGLGNRQHRARPGLAGKPAAQAGRRRPSGLRMVPLVAPLLRGTAPDLGRTFRECSLHRILSGWQDTGFREWQRWESAWDGEVVELGYRPGPPYAPDKQLCCLGSLFL